MKSFSLLFQFKLLEINWLSLGFHRIINKNISSVHSMLFLTKEDLFEIFLN